MSLKYCVNLKMLCLMLLLTMCPLQCPRQSSYPSSPYKASPAPSPWSRPIREVYEAEDSKVPAHNCMQTNTHRDAHTHTHTVRSAGAPPSGSPGRRGAVGAQRGRAPWCGPAGLTSGRASGTLVITFSITHPEPKGSVYTSLRNAGPDEWKQRHR